VVIGKVLLQSMDARTFVRNQVRIKTGCTEDVLFSGIAKTQLECPFTALS
jgi:hypothetical protein